MPEEQFKAFLEAIKNNSELQSKLKKASGPNEVQAIANEGGFDIRVDEILRFQEASFSKLNDNELEGLAGGATVGCDTYLGNGCKPVGTFWPFCSGNIPCN